MVKRNFVIYTDSELIEIAKQNNINISFEFTEFLKQRLLNLTTTNQNQREMIEKAVIEAQNKYIALQNELNAIKSREEIEIKTKDKKHREELEKYMR